MKQCTIDTAFGRFLLTADGDFLTGVAYMPNADSVLCDGDSVLVAAQTQLMEYFCGKRKNFDLPLKYDGTPFQQRVWDALRDIPYGQTLTYGELAARCGNPRAFRAVGGACHRNPLLIVVPCHRVVACGGGLGGFGAGLPLKIRLLDLECSGH